jgi:hypothetical protein
LDVGSLGTAGQQLGLMHQQSGGLMPAGSGGLVLTGHAGSGLNVPGVGVQGQQGDRSGW